MYIYIYIYIYVCVWVTRDGGGQAAGSSDRKGPADSGHRSAGCRPWVRQIA